MKQSEIMKQLSDKELKQQLLLSQLFIAATNIILSFFLFDSVLDWLLYFNWDIEEIFMYGVLPGITIVVFDLVIIRLFPKEAYDDGGINERIFRNQSVIYYIQHFFASCCFRRAIISGSDPNRLWIFFSQHLIRPCTYTVFEEACLIYIRTFNKLFYRLFVYGNGKFSGYHHRSLSCGFSAWINDSLQKRGAIDE